MQEQPEQGSRPAEAAKTIEQLRVPVRGRPGEYILNRIVVIEEESLAARQRAACADLGASDGWALGPDWHGHIVPNEPGQVDPNPPRFGHDGPSVNEISSIAIPTPALRRGQP